MITYNVALCYKLGGCIQLHTMIKQCGTMVKLDLHKTYMHMMPYGAIKCFTITYYEVLCTTVHYNGIKKR